MEEEHIIEQMAYIQWKRRNNGNFVREEEAMEQYLVELFDAVVAYEECQCQETAERMVELKNFCLIRWPERAREIIGKATIHASKEKLLDMRFQTVV